MKQKPNCFLNICIVFIISLSMILMGPVPQGLAQASATSPSQAETPQTGTIGSNISAPAIRYLYWTGYDQIKEEPLYIINGTTQILRFDRPLTRIAVSNPGICDITPLGTQEILIRANATGRMNLVLWDQDYNICSYNVVSIIDVDKLYEMLMKIDPKANLSIFPFNDKVAIYGWAENSYTLGQINAAIGAFGGGIPSFVQIRDPKQILLEVRFAEITRNSNSNYGLDFGTDWATPQKFYTFRSLYGDVSSTDGSFTPAEGGGGWSDNGGVFDQAAAGGPASLSFFQGSANNWFAPTLQALIRKGVAKIIARPNLLAKDGQEASFLVGGQFPIPVSTPTSVSVQYQDYGTQLKFTPNVLDKGVIRLQINTEVSEIDTSNSVSVGASVVPALIRRNQQTVAELKDNQTLVVGGMITQRISESESKLPILGDIPVLDRLFKSTSMIRSDVELLVIIVPHIVAPFETSDHKEYFSKEDARDIENSVRVFKGPFPDEQADAMRSVITQNEQHQEFYDWGKTPEKKKEDLPPLFANLNETEIQPQRQTPIEIVPEETSSEDFGNTPSALPSSGSSGSSSGTIQQRIRREEIVVYN